MYMSDIFRTQLVPEKVRVLPEFDLTNQIEIRVGNTSDKKLKGKLKLYFPRDVEWKLADSVNHGDYTGEFSLDGKSRRKLKVHLRAIGSEPRTASFVANIETNAGDSFEDIVQLELDPTADVENSKD